MRNGIVLVSMIISLVVITFSACEECKFDTECPMGKVCYKNKCVFPNDVPLPDGGDTEDTIPEDTVDFIDGGEDLSIDIQDIGFDTDISDIPTDTGTCNYLSYQWVGEKISEEYYPSGDDGSIVIDSNMVVHVTYNYFGSVVTNNDYDTQLRYGRKAGMDSSWNIETLDRFMCGKYTSLKLDRNGVLHLTYRKWGASQEDIQNGFPDLTAVLYMNNLGGQWNRFEVVDTEGDVGRHTSLQLDSQGNPHVAYFFVAEDRENPPSIIDPGNVKYAVKRGGNWQIETVDIGEYMGDFVGERVILILDSQDTPHLFYFDYGVCEPDDTVECSRGHLCRDFCYTPPYGEGDNTNYCDEESCRNDSSSRLKHAWKDRTTGRWNIEVIDNDAGSNDYGDFATITAAFDSQGNIHLFYYNKSYRFPGGQSGQGGIIYMTNRGGRWTRELFKADGKFPSMVIDSSGYIHLIYQDLVEGNLMYTTNAPDGIWRTFVAFQGYTGNILAVGDWANLTQAPDGSLHAIFVGNEDSPGGPRQFPFYAHTVPCN